MTAFLGILGLAIEPKKSGKDCILTDKCASSSIKNQEFLLRNMSNYQDFPPFNYFIRTLKSCPKSSFLYAQLWKRKGSRMDFSIQKKDIRKDYLVSPTMFRNLLAPLMFLSLVNFLEVDEKYQITLVGFDLNE